MVVRKSALARRSGQARVNARNAHSGDGRVLPLIKRLKSIAARIPQRELDRLPPDLIENLDHYIYGTPKR